MRATLRWSRRVLPAVALALAAVLPGCLDSNEAACPGTTTWGRVEAIEGSDVRVVLRDGSPAVLHTADSEYFHVADAECHEAHPDDLRIGQDVEFDADRWAESYPPQAWPDHVVIQG